MGAHFSDINRSKEVTFEERQFIRAICEDYAKKTAQTASRDVKKPSPFAQVLEGIEKNHDKKI